MSDSRVSHTRPGELPDRVVIKVRDNGPYKVTGPIELIDADGNRFELDPSRPVALCRCGASATKPFCDKSHREAGFAGCERAGTASARAGATVCEDP